nr:MAG TPA: hypothetical protein [Caudoviricetes sp.]
MVSSSSKELKNNFCALSICLGVATHRVRSPLFILINQQKH